MPSQPSVYYGEGLFSLPSSDDEDDYAKESNNNPNGTIRYEYKLRNREDEEELVVGGYRHPVHSRFLSHEHTTLSGTI